MNKHAANRRSGRVSGRRRSLIPYRLLGWLMLVSAGALILFFFLVWQPDLLWLILLLVAFGKYCLRLARRLKTAPVVIPSSKESVLYLRAFDDELRAFAVGPRRKLKRYTNQLDAHTPSESLLVLLWGFPHRGNPTITLSLDDFLKEAITARLGPFVALGNPTDRLPPDAAVREYAPDAVWKQRVFDLALSAKCIVIALGESHNLQWELNQIREQGMCQKLCMFTPPRRYFGDISER